jgi:hypothetical protein
LPLIYVQERAGGPKLIGGNHELGASDATCRYIYTLRITVSSINLHAQNINAFSFSGTTRTGRREQPAALDLYRIVGVRCVDFSLALIAKLIVTLQIT